MAQNPCENQVGVKNITLTFHECATGNSLGPLAHQLADDNTLPSSKTCARNVSELSGGRTKVAQGSCAVKVTLIPQIQVPLAWYQGCAAIDIQIEYLDGRVITAKGGMPVQAGDSSYESVEMDLRYPEVDEYRPQEAA